MSAKEHPHLATIERYYHGCNTADVALMRSTFCDDVVHYFTHHPPVRGADALAAYWAKIGPRFQDWFSVDHFIAQDDEAVIEWTLQLVMPQGDGPELIRGAEWYCFRDGLIAEIRAYYVNRHLPVPGPSFELEGFPYRERGYYVLGDRTRPAAGEEGR